VQIQLKEREKTPRDSEAKTGERNYDGQLLVVIGSKVEDTGKVMKKNTYKGRW